MARINNRLVWPILVRVLTGEGTVDVLNVQLCVCVY